jgi:acyl carrier protein
MTPREGEVYDLIVRFVENNFPTLDPGSIDRTTELLSNGLDSLSVLELLNILSDEFGVQLDGTDLTADHFETVGTLVTLIASKRN